MAGIPIINGVQYDWGSISLPLLGITPVTQITKISYIRKQKKENIYGAGYDPIGRGYGNKEYEGSIEMYSDLWFQIINAAPNNDPLQIPYFDLPVVFANTGQSPVRDILRAVEFLEDPFAASQGETKLLVTIPLIIGLIDRQA